MTVQYFVELRDDPKSEISRFDMDPKLPSEPTEGMSQEQLDALHSRMREAIAGLVADRTAGEFPHTEFVRWWLEDETGKVIEESAAVPGE